MSFEHVGQSNETFPISLQSIISQFVIDDPLLCPDVRQAITVQLIQGFCINLSRLVSDKDTFEHS